MLGLQQRCPWIKFLLNAVIETSKKGKNTFSSILSLKNEIH
jgi:hypothetical protein